MIYETAHQQYLTSAKLIKLPYFRDSGRVVFSGRFSWVDQRPLVIGSSWIVLIDYTAKDKAEPKKRNFIVEFATLN